MATTFTSSQSKVLERQQIDEHGPGTILADYQALLEFIGVEGIQTGGKYYLLPLATLRDIDERMTHPLRPNLTRPQQKSFPHLNGLYMLLRASGMGVTSGQGTTGRLSIHPDRWAEWESLNPTERYFTLLQAMMTSDWSLIESGPRGSGPGRELAWSFQHYYLDRVRKREGTFAASDIFSSWRQQTVAALLELFGLLEIPRKEPQKKENWRVGTIVATKFGEALLKRLCSPSTIKHLLDFHEQLASGDEHWLGDLFREFFPECNETLNADEGEFVEGLWQFKVSLGSVWRRIVIPAELSVDDLIYQILRAYKFDDDHLYEMRFRDRSGRNIVLGPPMLDAIDGCTDECAIGWLPLDPGQAMTFIFDFGDNWQFNVTLEEVLPPDDKVTAPKVTAKRGKAPAQYRYDDEW